MRFHQLQIHNFRAISRFEVNSLAKLVIIAGPNGCGKSQVLDAIRLLKSAYGGYQSNETMQWFGEFQMAPNDLSALFRNHAEPVRISATIELSDEEVAYLQNNAYQVLEPIVWSEVTRQPLELFQFSTLTFTAQFPQLVPLVAQRTQETVGALAQELTASSHTLSLTIEPNNAITITPSTTARVIFQTFRPAELGIIDFHSSQRIYTREGLGGINLDLKAIEGQRRVQSLYNIQNKYANVKSELVATYVRGLVAEAAGLPSSETQSLEETLKELFRTFFPHKSYIGIQIDEQGVMSFPVELSTGERHDINDLSSGEKEILYGYLRLKNSTPHHSTILLDEPEMHLNPALLTNMPDFYYRHLVQTNDNQVWLVTHSDALLRHAVGNPDYSVYHMTNAINVVASGNNQVLPVAEDELQAVLVDLVGDLAAYRPFAKVLIFEGETDTSFDVSMVQQLFPGLAERVTMISGRSKGRVNDLYGVLARIADQVGLSDKYYAITDRDSTPSTEMQTGTHVLSWGSYHIENYLLSAVHILKAISGLGAGLTTVPAVEAALKAAAGATLEGLVLRRLQVEVNDRLVQSINIGGGGLASPANALLPSIEASYERIEEAKSELTDSAWLGNRETKIRSEFQNALDTGEWVKIFPGRPVLKEFVHANCRDLVKYEGFVNLVIEKMALDNYQPTEMIDLLSQVVENP
jgi:predicted ATPase